LTGSGIVKEVMIVRMVLATTQDQPTLLVVVAGVAAAAARVDGRSGQVGKKT